MRLIAGFDAGQTHTSCRLALAQDSQGRGVGPVIGEGEGPGVCHLAAPEGPGRFGAALRESLERAMAPLANASPAAVLVAAAVGASGIEQGTAVQGHGRALAAEALGLAPERVLVSGDERTALRGAFGDGAGIVVISGTGTIAVGRDGQGREHRCAGWGWLLDGAGSAMDIGRDGLALSLQMAMAVWPRPACGGPCGRPWIWIRTPPHPPSGSRRWWWPTRSAPPASPGWHRWSINRPPRGKRRPSR